MMASLSLGCASSPGTKSDVKATKEGSSSASASYVRDFSGGAVTQYDKKDCKWNESKLDKLSWKEKVQIANACVAASDWARVESLGLSLAEADVQNPWGAYFLGLAAEGRGQSDRASWMNEQALKKNPNFGMLHYQKGRLAWKRQDFTGGLESLLKSVQLDPNLIEAHLFLGQIFFRDQDFGRAARHFQAVLRARPKDTTAIMGLAECQIQLSDARGALEMFKKGQDYHPGDSIFLAREAYVHEVLLNDTPKALQLYQRIQRGNQDGSFKRDLGFNVQQKITDLQRSLQQSRSLAGTKSEEVR